MSDAMSDELSDLRLIIQKLEGEKNALQARVTKAEDYLLLIQEDPAKTKGELSIIDMALDYLREDV